MPAESGDVSSRVLNQSLQDASPTFTEGGEAPKTATKYQNTTGYNTDVIIPLKGKAAISAIKLYNPAKVEKVNLGAFELPASTSALLQFKLPVGWYFELTFTEGTFQKPFFQT